MPRLPKDYSRTVQYKIVCNDLSVNFVYNGHTTDFIKRKNNHKSICNNPKDKCYNFNVYQKIRENGGWENRTMIELEKYPCKDSNEAGARERYWYEQLQSNLNIRVPNRSQREYNQTHKEKIKEHNHVYYKQNKEKIQLYHQKYQQENKDNIKEWQSQYFTCECGNIFKIGHKSRHQKTKKHLNYLEQLETTQYSSCSYNIF